jgi:hypothetical protein
MRSVLNGGGSGIHQVAVGKLENVIENVTNIKTKSNGFPAGSRLPNGF